MTSYTIKYTINKEKNSSRVNQVNVDAKDLKSAKHKIESKLAKQYNRLVTPSKQVKLVKVTLLDVIINGYY